MSKLKLTIITPNLNGAEYLEECIFSVLNQGYENLNFVIIDGGSTDDSLEIIKKYKVKYEVLSDLNNYEAIDYGLKKYGGDIQAWINSDDKYLPGAFCSIIQLFEDYSEIEWVTGIPVYSNGVGALFPLSLSGFPSRSKWTFLVKKNHFIPQDATFWRSSLYKKVNGLSSEYQYANDYKLWIDFFKYSKLYEIPQVISIFRQHSDEQISVKNWSIYLKEVNEINKKFYSKKFLCFFMRIALYIDLLLISIPIIRLVYYRLKLREKYLGFSSKIIFTRTFKLIKI